MSTNALDARLLLAKVSAVVRAGGAEPRPAPGFGLGAAVVDAADAPWVLLAHDPVHAVGPALAWARKHSLAPLHLLVDDPADAAVVARRAAAFDPAPTVWLALPTGPVAVEAGAPVRPHDVPSPEAELFAALFRELDLDLVVEHGVVTAEWLGLEVGRLVPAEVDGDPGSSRLVLRVGVGHIDQIAGEVVNHDVTDSDALASAAAIVRRHRRADAVPHPLTQLVPERWLRRVVLAHPDLVGATALEPVAPVPGRRNLRERGVAPLVGRDAAGRDLVVVCSTGVDLDVIPAAADARLSHAPGARLVVVLPEGDVHAVTVALAAQLAEPADLVAIPGDWRALLDVPDRAGAGGGDGG
jgi:hypothetical protein